LAQDARVVLISSRICRKCCLYRCW